MQQTVDAFMSSMSAEEYAKDHYKLDIRLKHWKRT